MCAGMRVDMCVDMCEEMCVEMRVEAYVVMCEDMTGARCHRHVQYAVYTKKRGCTRVRPRIYCHN